MPVDVFGEEINIMDYILTSRKHEENELVGFRVIGISKQGYLKLDSSTKYSWDRKQLQNTAHCVKITEEQYKKLKK
jgi:di/tripeptidase